jgi:hypothetical protein
MGRVINPRHPKDLGKEEDQVLELGPEEINLGRR